MGLRETRLSLWKKSTSLKEKLRLCGQTISGRSGPVCILGSALTHGDAVFKLKRFSSPCLSLGITALLEKFRWCFSSSTLAVSRPSGKASSAVMLANALAEGKGSRSDAADSVSSLTAQAELLGALNATVKLLLSVQTFFRSS